MPEDSAEELTLLTRRGCHLCDEVRTPLARLAEARGIVLRELDIDDHLGYLAQFTDRVPVLLSGDVVLAEGRFQPGKVLGETAGGHHSD